MCLLQAGGVKPGFWTSCMILEPDYSTRVLQREGGLQPRLSGCIIRAWKIPGLLRDIP